MTRKCGRCLGFNNARSREKTGISELYSLTSLYISVDDVDFCDGPRMCSQALRL